MRAANDLQGSRALPVDDASGTCAAIVILEGMVPGLAAVAAASGGAFTRSDAKAAGYSDAEIRSRLETGSWVRLRRSVYVEAETLTHLDEVAQHRLTCRSALLALDVPAAISHHSGAMLQSLATHPTTRERGSATVELTTRDGGTARRHPGLFVHRIPLAPDEWVELDGIAVTSAGRTVIDLAASRPFVEAVVTADSALRAAKTSPEQLAELAHRRPRRGVARMDRVISFADGLSESVGESVSRVGLAGQGLPTPALQFVVGAFRSDFAWPELRTLGEFDGRLKYTDQNVLWAEKLREDELRDLGWELVRWTWSQITLHPELVAHRLRRAFARGTRRAG